VEIEAQLRLAARQAPSERHAVRASAAGPLELHLPHDRTLTRFLRFTKEPKGYLEVASTEIRNAATAARLG
jgi:hypothetical protein